MVTMSFSYYFIF